ncbi:MAG: sulfite exporter TauE/SafE family protein [Coprobacillus cateniformis]|uniref:sulfite exporter TauE/SafE family protein n=1 Tax=Longibaculum muris TaxID=1796628 RepID=UPI003AB3ECA0|nr:sulfite exporter TauE/SafE family protein [Coprobacillus cateniformis]
MIYFIIFTTTILAGFIQSVSGFGAGIVIMSILPYFFSVLQASAICNFISIFLCASLACRYRNFVQKKYIPFPGLFFILGATLAIYISTSLDVRFLKIILGLFLLFLAIYFVLFSHKVSIKANYITMFLCGFISGVCDGLFSIGGPLMVLFFLSLTKSKEEYLGTMSAFLLIVCCYNLGLRIYWNIFTIRLLPYSILGVIAVYIGLKLGNKVVDKIDDELLKKLTYGLIAVSGFITFITAI